MVLTPDDRQQTEMGARALIQPVLWAHAGQQNASEDLQYCRHLCNYLTHLIGDNGAACELAQESFVNACKTCRVYANQLPLLISALVCKLPCEPPGQ